MAGQPVPDDAQPLIRPCEGRCLPAGTSRSAPANDPLWNVRVSARDVLLSISAITLGLSPWAVIALVVVLIGRRVWP